MCVYCKGKAGCDHVTDLCSVCSNQIQRPHGAVQETRDLHEVVVADGPGTVDQENQISLGLLAHWTNTDAQSRYVKYISSHFPPTCV